MVSRTNLQVISIFALACLTASVSAGGKKDFEQECSMLSQVSNVFTKEQNDEPNACNTDKGLICVGNKCKCSPGKAYEQGILGGVFGGGTCVGAANRPCLPNDESTRCVSHAECTGQGLGLCTCKEGYSATLEGHCSNASNRVPAELTPMFIALALMYSVLKFIT